MELTEEEIDKVIADDKFDVVSFSHGLVRAFADENGCLNEKAAFRVGHMMAHSFTQATNLFLEKKYGAMRPGDFYNAMECYRVIIQFMKDNDVTCSETIYQTDRVILNAYEFIDALYQIVESDVRHSK